MAVWLTPPIRTSFPTNAQHWLDYMDRARSLGASVGADFGSYNNPSTFDFVGYDTGYDNPYIYAMWDNYKACSDNQSCAGMANQDFPRPPTIQN